MKSFTIARVGPLSISLLSASRKKKFDQLCDSQCPQHTKQANNNKQQQQQQQKTTHLGRATNPGAKT